MTGVNREIQIINNPILFTLLFIVAPPNVTAVFSVTVLYLKTIISTTVLAYKLSREWTITTKSLVRL